MINSKADLKRYLKTEKAKYNPSFFGMISALFGYSEKNMIWRYQKRLRKWEYHLNKNHKLRAKWFDFKTTCLGRKYGYSISPNCFDEGLHLMHVGSIVVNSTARIGKNCSMHINCAIVATGGVSDSAQAGDNLVMGIGSTLVGKIVLGNQVVVGAGAVVTKSFEEDHITIAGVPAKIISHKAII